MKKSYLLFILLFLPLFTIEAYGSTSNRRNYSYIEYSASYAIGTHASHYLEGESSEGEPTYNYSTINTSLLDAQYNSNILLGYHFMSGLSFEFEMASYDYAFNKINGKIGINNDASLAYVTNDYNMINIKYDLLYLGDYTIYAKAGAGVMNFNFPFFNIGDGGSNLEPTFQFIAGTSYAINNIIDFSVSYKFLFNMPSLEQVVAVSSKQRINFKESALYLSVKLKI